MVRVQILALAGLASLLLPLSCGPGDGGPPPVCGNGITEPPEQCDHGASNGEPGNTCSKTCKDVVVQHPRVNVVWELVKHTAVASYLGTTCVDVGADTAKVLLSGPSRVELDVACSQYQQVISGVCTTLPDNTLDCTQALKPGSYTATVTLLRGSDATRVTQSVTSGAKMVTFGAAVDLFIDFRTEDFLQPYFGSLNLQTSWGRDGVQCGSADPPVVQESIVLQTTDESPPQKTKTIPGTPLDGSANNGCFVPTQNRSYEEAPNLLWGPYRLRIRGYAQGKPDPAYCGLFDVFVGPGRNTLPFAITVPPAPMTDAGINCP